MKKPLFYLVLLIFMPKVFAGGPHSDGDLGLLRNDKEPIIKAFSRKEKVSLQNKYKDKEQINFLSQIFYDSVKATINNPSVCELNLAKEFKARLEANNFSSNAKMMDEYLKVIRINHSIDDILYRITSEAINDHEELSKLNFNKRISSKKKADQALIDANDLNDLFINFVTWPDDIESCTYQEFYYLQTNVFLPNGKKTKKKNDVKDLIHEAYLQKIISAEVYHKLNYFNRKAKLNKRDLWLNDYLKIIFKSKNKMIPPGESYEVKQIEDEDDYSQEKIRRFSKITRRRLLYRKYNDVQIIMLAQVLQNASRRMGVDPDTKSSTPIITQEFWVTTPSGEERNYVEVIELDPQSQYNLARRRMRKDIIDLQMMDIFADSTITHEDVVLAALETGYITLDDIAYVVKYDDLWNPQKSKFEKISRFIFTVTGYSTFFLPPPWNIIASLALGVVEGVVDSKNPNNGASNDNPATFIE